MGAVRAWRAHWGGARQHPVTRNQLSAPAVPSLVPGAGRLSGTPHLVQCLPGGELAERRAGMPGPLPEPPSPHKEAKAGCSLSLPVRSLTLNGHGVLTISLFVPFVLGESHYVAQVVPEVTGILLLRPPSAGMTVHALFLSSR